MSYVRKETGDSINNYFHDISNFMNILPNMINAQTKDEFQIWFDKLYIIDKRSLFLYISDNKDLINPMNHEYVNMRFKKDIF